MRIEDTIHNFGKMAKENRSGTVADLERTGNRTTATRNSMHENIVEIIVVALGICGVSNTLMDALEYSVVGRFLVLVCAIGAGAFWVIVRKLKEYTLTATLVALGICLVMCLVTFPILKNGVLGIIDECIWDFPSYNNTTEEGWAWTLIIFAVLAAYIISMNVTRIRSMLLAVVHILPLIVLFVVVEPIPSVWSLLLCVTYALGVGALRRNDSSTRGAVVIITVTLVVGFVCYICINEYNYKSPKLFDDIYYRIEHYMAEADKLGLDNSQGKDSGKNEGDADSDKDSDSGEIGIGKKGIFGTSKLGDVEELKYANKDILVATTIRTNRNQYIPIYYGIQYTRKDNCWSIIDAYTEEESPKTDTTYVMLQTIGNSPDMQKYVAGDIDTYNRNVVNYQYTYKRGDEDRVYSGYIHEVNDAYYSKFYDIAMQNVTLEAGENKHGYTQKALASTHNTLFNRAKNGFYMERQEFIYKFISGLQEFNMVDYEQSEALRTIKCVKKVKDYLSANYTYTLSPGKVPEGKDFVEYFLTDSKQGYCTYFATAATLMFRAMGVPARYVEGFVMTPEQISQGKKIIREDAWSEIISMGEAVQTQTAYKVNIKDMAAHAWVEIFMPGYGWLVVEVTPAYDGEGITGTEQEESMPEDESQPETESEQEETEEDTEEDTEETQSETGSENSQEEGGISPGDMWKIGLSAIVVVAVIALLLRHIVKYMKYRRVLNSSDIVAVYELMERVLNHTGYGRADSISYEEYAKQLEATNEVFRMFKMERITELALKARFGGEGVTVNHDDKKKACDNLRGIRGTLMSRFPWYKKLFYVYIKIM